MWESMSVIIVERYGLNNCLRSKIRGMWFFNEETDMALAFLCLMVMGVIAVGVMLTGLRGMTLAASRPAFRRWNYH